MGVSVTVVFVELMSQSWRAPSAISPVSLPVISYFTLPRTCAYWVVEVGVLLLFTLAYFTPVLSESVKALVDWID